MLLFILIAVVCGILQLFLPWWIIALVAFGLSFWKARNGNHAFGSGFFAIFALWIIAALFHTLPNENILANRVGAMLGLPETSINWIITLLISGTIGGLAGAFSALAGVYSREALNRPEKKLKEN